MSGLGQSVLACLAAVLACLVDQVGLAAGQIASCAAAGTAGLSCPGGFP